MRYFLVWIFWIFLGTTVASATSVSGWPMQKDTLPDYGFWKNGEGQDSIQLKDPGFVEKNIEYDPSSGNYLISEKMGSEFYRAPANQFRNTWIIEVRSSKENINKLSGLSSAKSSLSDRLDPIARFDLKADLLDRLFGGNKIEITRKVRSICFWRQL